MATLRLRDVVNAGLYRLNWWFLWFSMNVQRRWGYDRTYQPNAFAVDSGEPAKRLCNDRFEAFAAHLPQEGPLSSLDIGCSQGYFTFRMAQRGGLCIGIDHGRNEIMVARATAVTYGVDNAIFAQLDVDAAVGRTLPRTDVVICMSVFHHWVRKKGLPEAKRIMAAVASRAERCLIFETGQPEEPGVTWAKSLEFMGENPDRWIRSFLSDLGFATIHNAGQFVAEVSGVPRYLYVAVREPA